jgi:hypothetical protein
MPRASFGPSIRASAITRIAFAAFHPVCIATANRDLAGQLSSAQLSAHPSLEKEDVMHGWIESRDWSELVWVAGWLAALIVLGIALSIHGNHLKT